MTGKTTLLESVAAHHRVDLLDLQAETRYRTQPEILWEELNKLKPNSTVIIDEIQKIPELLDTVQRGIDKLKLRFILSGSSARKLKRSGANLLGGRAIDLRIFPLTLQEINGRLELKEVLRWGSLPRIATLLETSDVAEVVAILRTYQSLYIQQEIQIEALVRNLTAFQRFLQIAAACHGQIIEYSTIARDCGVSAPTVKEYFQILEDSLVANLLWPYDRSERKKARPKFYFFDNGVVRAIQGRLTADPSPEELGHLFEGWFVQEARRILHYHGKEHELALWRKDRHEIDLLFTRSGKPVLAMEIKSGQHIRKEPSEDAFKAIFPKVPLLIVSLKDRHNRKTEEGREILSVSSALEMIKGL